MMKYSRLRTEQAVSIAEYFHEATELAEAVARGVCDFQMNQKSRILSGAAVFRLWAANDFSSKEVEFLR